MKERKKERIDSNIVSAPKKLVVEHTLAISFSSSQNNHRATIFIVTGIEPITQIEFLIYMRFVSSALREVIHGNRYRMS